MFPTNEVEEKDLNKKDYGVAQYCPELSLVTQNIPQKRNHMVRSIDRLNFKDPKDKFHAIIPNVPSSFHNAKKSPDPSNPEESSPNNLNSFQDCERSFIKKHDLVVPQRSNPSEKHFSCVECWKSFIKKSHLVELQRIHTGEKPFACSECEKSFRKKSNLVVHQRIHTSEKPFSFSK
ncbi:hypothetical protein AB205_0003260, partial [Aquarana catesbeiana]